MNKDLSGGIIDCNKGICLDFNLMLKQNLWTYKPLVELRSIVLKQPTDDDSLSDKERLLKYVNEGDACDIELNDIDIIRMLPETLRENGWKLEVVIGQKDKYKEILWVCKEKNVLYGIAVDVGTTTICISLVDIIGKRVIARKSSFNRQMVFGEDIISRILFSEKENGLEQLRQKVIFTINDLIDELLLETKIHASDVYAIVFSGNTTMIHFLYGISAKNIRRQPYVPAAVRMPILTAKVLRLMINPHALVYSIPNVASYIGGDIVCGVVSCRISKRERVSVLIDLGTNGEIVVGNKEFLVCAACSAGPAFEGGGIKCGMPAGNGAVMELKIFNDEINLKTINDEPSIGICGSGLISAVAEMFKFGIIDKSGTFVKNSFVINNKERIRVNEDGEKEFIVADKKDGDLVITESDIKILLRSKGAIFHGLFSLLKSLDIGFNEIEKLYISGGFGNFINIENAKVIGLLPDIEEDKFVISGNTSLLGAELFLVSPDVRREVDEVASKMTYVDLSTMPFYMNEYVSSLFIPHTDLNLFPNISKRLKL